MFNRLVQVVVLVWVAAGAARGGVLELRDEVAVVGHEVRLKQLARWAPADNAVFAPVADLVVLRLGPGQEQTTLTLAELREVMEGAGMGAAEVSYRGPVQVRLRRLDAGAVYAQRAMPKPAKDLGEFLDRAETASANGEAKAEAASADEAEVAPTPVVVTASPVVVTASPVVTAQPMAPPVKAAGESLKEMLVKEMARRLGLGEDEVEVSFEARDERVLRLTSGAFRIGINSMRARGLGQVTWGVTLTSADGQSRQVNVSATARAWMTQTVAVTSLSAGQRLREEDVEVRRVLVERMPDDMLLTREQALMMQAARPLAAGTVLTARTLDPVLLVKQGQLVTLTLRQGAFEVRTVAKAMEGGAYGSTIRVMPEQSGGKPGESMFATVTGVQEARLGPGMTGEVAKAGTEVP